MSMTHSDFRTVEHADALQRDNPAQLNEKQGGVSPSLPVTTAGYTIEPELRATPVG